MHRSASIWKLIAIMLILPCGGLCAAGKTKSATPSTKRKQATPAKGDLSDQTINVENPYCDAYWPYHFGGGNFSTITADKDQKKGGSETFFTDEDPSKASDDPSKPNQTPPQPGAVADFVAYATNTGDFTENTADKGSGAPIAKDGSFYDTGFPLLGNDAHHFYTNGADLTRLLGRLVYVGYYPDAQKPNHFYYTHALPMCKGDTGKPPVTADPTIPNMQYFLVHIVRWQKKGGSYVTSSSDWYIFNKSDAKAAHREVPFTFHPVVGGDGATRIFGSNQVFFLAVHLAPEGDYSNFSDTNKLKISYKVKATKVEPANIQDLKALIGIVVGPGAAAGGGPLAPSIFLSQYTGLIGSSYAGLYGAAKLTGLDKLPVQITATMDATLPKADAASPDANAYANAGFWDALATKGEEATPSTSSTNSAASSKSNKGSSSTNSAASSNTGSSQTPPAPAQTGCSTTASSKAGGDCTESLTVQNEGLYRWDVSVGIPFNSIKQLQYESTGVAPKTISKQTAYGFLVLAPWKEDFVSPPNLGIPHLMFGLPFTGKILNSPFVGLGETINLTKLPGIGKPISKWIANASARFYAGLVENKTFGPQPAPGQSGPVRWIGKLQYGIEFSVRDISSKLNGSASSSTPTQTGKKTGSSSTTQSGN